jgi:hypothetical protein
MYQDQAAAGPLELRGGSHAGPARSVSTIRVAMRVFAAGDGGYIGAALVPFLRAAGHQVDGLDPGLLEAL